MDLEEDRGWERAEQRGRSKGLSRERRDFAHDLAKLLPVESSLLFPAAVLRN